MASRTTICTASEVLTYLGKGANATDAERSLINMLIPMVDSAIKTFLGWEVVQRTYTHILPDIDLFSLSTNDLGIPVDVVQNRISYYFPGQPVLLQLPEIPVRSVTSIYADYSAMGGQGPSDFASANLQTQGTDFYVDFDTLTDPTPAAQAGISWTGHVRRWIGVWPSRQRSIKATYVAGFTPDELDGVTAVGSLRCADIKFAAVLSVAAAFQESRAIRQGGPIVGERLGDYGVQYGSVTSVLGMMGALPFKAQCLLQPFVRMRR